MKTVFPPIDTLVKQGYVILGEWESPTMENRPESGICYKILRKNANQALVVITIALIGNFNHKLIREDAKSPTAGVFMQDMVCFHCD